MPIDTGGGGSGIWSRLGQQAPGMMNALAQQHGDPRLKPMNRATGDSMSRGGGVFGNRPRPGMNIPGRPMQGPSPSPMGSGNITGGMPPPSPMAPTGGIDTGSGVMPPQMGPQNGMSGFGGGMRPPFEQSPMMGGQPSMMSPQGGGGGGLWQMYNQLSQGMPPQGMPQRRPQMFY